VPLGVVRYRLGSIGVAIEICEEAWDSIPASAAHADAVDLILNPSASHFALGKYAKREHLVANSSRSMQVIYVYTNLLGLEAGRMIYDGGVLFAEGGEVVQRGRRFGFGDGELVYRDVNPELASLSKLKVKPVRDGGDSAPGQTELRKVEIQGRDPRTKPHLGAKASPKRASGGTVPTFLVMTREEEFLQAEMLGLFDYLRKTKAKGYVVPLSGGCDSACCAVLVGHMVAAGLAELGHAGFAKRLGFPVAASAGPRDLAKELLTCLYLPSKNSGKATQNAAKAVAEAVGATFQVVDVKAQIDAYTQGAEAVLGRKLTWEQDDITLQNVQARARAPLVWTVANAKNALLISTSNRSEAAVGYATMDGDTAGGLAPLAGIDKPFLRHWLQWVEGQTRLGLGALPGLSAVNALAPTAELRPPGEEQTDEDDLMPYPVLERIERYLVRDRLGPDDILQTLAFDFPDTPLAELQAFCDKFFTLWSRNQWKRERLAPSFHLDDESLDPKSWCRFPILSAPYRTTP
jgi:NAD+ synthase (glutamine-hydrolysing)